jgi:RHS repeat-associated protein
MAGENTRENFTGKELDKDGVGTDLADAGTNTVTGVQLSYFGKRYYDAMAGMWVACDPKMQFYSPYLYTGNEVNPIIGFDPNGKDIWVLNNPNGADGLGHNSVLIGNVPFLVETDRVS